MAHYVQIPKDLNDIKQKFMFGLTKRQVVSFGIEQRTSQAGTLCGE